MRWYRCFHDGALEPGQQIALSREEASHLTKVRRVRPGGDVLVLNGRGRECRAKLTGGGLLEVHSLERDEPAPPRAVELAPGLTRTNAFEETFSRAIELGMTGFRPVEPSRGVVKLDDRKRAARLERWRRLAIERLKQCERLWLPEIHEPAPLGDVLDALANSGVTALALRERGEQDLPSWGSAMAALAGADVCLLVGPEGGWDTGEEAMLERPGVRGVSLGRAVLRAETAALAAMAGLFLEAE